MTELTVSEPLPDYALGRSEHETGRLILQHQVYGPFTRQLLIGAGIGRGMRVLDLGSGAGDVALLLAELVGPQGEVVGTDVNPDILATARARAGAAGWDNITFAVADLHDLDVGTDFDAVVGRWILMYLPDPAGLLRRLRGCLRPGGIVAFQESDLRVSRRTYPPAPLHETVLSWMTPPEGAPGPELAMGPKLFATFLAAHLPAPQLRYDTPIGGGPDWPGYAFVAATVRSLLPFLEQIGASTAEDVDIETLEMRLRDEIVARDGVQLLPSVVGAWTRV